MYLITPSTIGLFSERDDCSSSGSAAVVRQTKLSPGAEHSFYGDLIRKKGTRAAHFVRGADIALKASYAVRLLTAFIPAGDDDFPGQQIVIVILLCFGMDMRKAVLKSDQPPCPTFQPELG